MPTIDECEVTLAKLHTKRSKLFDRSKELPMTRQEISYAANTGDAKAEKRLDEITTTSCRVGRHYSAPRSNLVLAWEPAADPTPALNARMPLESNARIVWQALGRMLRSRPKII